MFDFKSYHQDNSLNRYNQYNKSRLIKNYNKLLKNNLVPYGQMIFDDNLQYNKESKLFMYGSYFLNEDYYTERKYNVNDSINPNTYKQQEWDYLYEGLITTVKPEKVINILQRFFKNINIKAFITPKPFDDKKTDTIQVVLYKDDYENDENKQCINSINVIMQNFGYIFSHKDVYIKDFESYIVLIYDPEFLEEITDEVYTKYNGILYHITSSTIYNKILEKGLILRQHVINGYNIYIMIEFIFI